MDIFFWINCPIAGNIILRFLFDPSSYISVFFSLLGARFGFHASGFLSFSDRPTILLLFLVFDPANFCHWQISDFLSVIRMKIIRSSLCSLCFCPTDPLWSDPLTAWLALLVIPKSPSHYTHISFLRFKNWQTEEILFPLFLTYVCNKRNDFHIAKTLVMNGQKEKQFSSV